MLPLAVLIFPLLIGSGVGVRDHERRKQDREVILLVTRHGLSCANLVDKWLPKAQGGNKFSKLVNTFKNKVKSKYHVLMPDPLLCGAGEKQSEVAGKAVKDWLVGRNLTVSAILSSVLARAVQTALHEYVRYNGDLKSIYVAPFIRESGVGRDNVASDFTDQMMTLGDLAVNVNPTFADSHGRDEKGDWDKFIEFLASHFLPLVLEEEIQDFTAPPLVLAVVTHSNFMMESIPEKCQLHYPKVQGRTTKPQNNQVVALHYKLRTQSETYVLEEDSKAQCEDVTRGMSMYDEKTNLPRKLCKKDIGLACEGLIKSKIKLLPKTVEEDIQDLRKRLETTADMDPFQHQLIADELLQLQKFDCWTGGKPSEA